jgi:hypothetical protein
MYTVANHGLSVYSVMSVTIYAVAFVGAVLITRMVRAGLYKERRVVSL